MIALKTTHHRHRELRRQIGILAKTLLRPAPSGVTRQVGIRGIDDQTLATCFRPPDIVAGLLGLDVTHPTYGLTVPRAAHAIGLGENGGGQVVGHLAAIYGLSSVVGSRSAEG